MLSYDQMGMYSDYGQQQSWPYGSPPVGYMVVPVAANGYPYAYPPMAYGQLEAEEEESFQNS